jgi:hypothetical protein
MYYSSLNEQLIKDGIQRFPININFKIWTSSGIKKNDAMGNGPCHGSH